MSVLTQHRQRQVASGRTKHLSHVLMQARVGLKRKDFDPSSTSDRLQYAYFMETGKWKDGMAFNVEVPYATVPVTVQSKLLRYFLEPELAKISQIQAGTYVRPLAVVPLMKDPKTGAILRAA